MISFLMISRAKNGDRLNDGDGLFFEVSKGGKKTWHIRKRVNGKVINKTIGQYPEMSLKDARACLASFNAEIETVKQEKEINGITFGELYEEWIAFKSSQVKDIKNLKQRLGIVLPKLKNIYLKDLKTLQIVTLIKEYTANGTQKLESAKRLANYIKQMEQYAVNSGYIEGLRYQGIGKVIPSPKTKSMSSIHYSQLPDVIKKFKEESVRVIFVDDLFYMALYTLLRPNEYCQMRWSWIKDDYIEIPADVMKMKRVHRVPITKQIRGLLNSRAQKKVDDFVFSSVQKPGESVKTSVLEKFLFKHGFKGILVPHGIRSIGRTWMRDNNVPHDVAEMCLAHKVGSNVEQAYNRSELFDERVKVLQAWDDFVESCLKI